MIFNGQESGTRISYYTFPLLWKLAIVWFLVVKKLNKIAPFILSMISFSFALIIKYILFQIIFLIKTLLFSLNNF